VEVHRVRQPLLPRVHQGNQVAPASSNLKKTAMAMKRYRYGTLQFTDIVSLNLKKLKSNSIDLFPSNTIF
jgi:hypothetical protein